MPYCTLQNLTDRYGEDRVRYLTDRAVPPAGTIDQSVVDQALLDTDGIIDAYLRGHYQLPIASVPGVLTDCAVSIAWYKLFREMADEKAVKDHDDARKTLREIASGQIQLGIDGVDLAAGGSELAESTDPYRPLSSDGPMPGVI